MTNIEPTRMQQVLTWLAVLAVAGILGWIAVMSARPSRADEAEVRAWAITATVINHENDKQHFEAFYNESGTVSPKLFDSEAACKKMLDDPKGDFRVNIWKKFVAVVKQHQDILLAPKCVAFESKPKGDSI